MSRGRAVAPRRAVAPLPLPLLALPLLALLAAACLSSLAGSSSSSAQEEQQQQRWRDATQAHVQGQCSGAAPPTGDVAAHTCPAGTEVLRAASGAIRSSCPAGGAAPSPAGASARAPAAGRSAGGGAGGGGEEERWETYIVRFREYEMLPDHKRALTKVLGHLQQLWSWVDRPNKATASHPSDFALLSVAPGALGRLQGELRSGLPAFRDMHLDRQIRGMLEWQPERSDEQQQRPQRRGRRQGADQPSPLGSLQQQVEQAAGAARLRMQPEPEVAAAEQQQQRRRRRLRQADRQPGEAGAAQGPEQQQQQQQQAPPQDGGDSAGAQGGHQQQQQESIWHVSKPPGRMRTRPTIGLDPSSQADREASRGGGDELRRSSRRRSLLGDRAGGLLGLLGPQARRGRRPAATRPDTRVTTLLEAGKLWEQGHSGKGIKVGVFDTGIRQDHPHIRNIKERTNWTHQPSLSDGLGHGSFVAGVIGSQDTMCPGFAPDVELYTFKVFTDDQVSYTSWFLDAFNYAIASRLHVINLSIGGPDWLDAPFVEKVWEVTSNGIIMVSAIGNDGPLYGTLNNPADQPDVVGVGGIDNAGDIADFSSRGMTTWELPTGTGRIKPDVMAYAKDVTGSKIQGGCRSLSGTSVASPVVAGAVCLLASTLPEDRRWLLNPASMKQALVEGASRLPKLNMHEQGSGLISLPASQAILASYAPRASLIPASIDLSDCPYAWPHCRQPLYAFRLPVVLNATVVNGMANLGRFEGEPEWRGADEGGRLLHVTFAHSEVLWPWSGYLAIYVEVSPSAWNFSGPASGNITFTISSPPQPGSRERQLSRVSVPLRAAIVPVPPRSRRVVWDVLHSVKYPPGYVPRDNLDIKSDVLDWHGDHPYTNFHDAFDALADAGFYVEVLSSPATCFDPANYGAYLVVDPEEEWYKEEVVALEGAVKEHGLALVVVAEWYHEESLRQMKFYDDNTRTWWTPVTGGANAPALNELLAPHRIMLGERILQGVATIGEHTLTISYGANIAAFPAGGYLPLSQLNDVAGQGAGVAGEYATFGVAPSGRGTVAVLGDSSCLDSSHNVDGCYDFLVALFQQLLLGKDAGLTPPEALLAQPFVAPGFTSPPLRRSDVNFTQYSWVLQHPLTCYANAPCQFRAAPHGCPAGAEWRHTHLQPGSEPPQAAARLPAAAAVPDGVGAEPRDLEAGVDVAPGRGGAQPHPQQQPAQQQQQQQQPAASPPQQQQPAGQVPKQPAGQLPKQPGSTQQQQQQQSAQPGAKQHSALQDEQRQQWQRRAIVSQAMTLATFICVVGVVGVVVMWRMRSGSGGAGGQPRKWGTRRWPYAPVGRARAASPLEA